MCRPSNADCLRIAFLFLLLLAALPSSAQRDPAAPDLAPLVLTPANTVILDGSATAGKALQYYLLKYYVSEQAAVPYAPDVKGNRAASPAFPLLAEGAGTALPAGKNILAVGATRFLTAEDRKRLEENDGAVLLERRGNVVVIAGSPLGSPAAGPFTAVSQFLDHCAGIRFYAPGDLWISRPRTKAITLTELDLFRKPFFAKCELSASPPRNREWLQMNRPITQGAPMRASHTLATYFPPEKYAATHPEIYPMRNGKRMIPGGAQAQAAWNPCLSAPALPELAMESVRAAMQRKPTPSYLSFGVMDYPFECECPACKRSVETHGGSYSTLYYTFLNEVARQCRKEFPHLVLTAYVYANVRTPPAGLRIEPNIVVDVVVKSYRWVIPADLAAEKARIQAFSDLGAGWLIHDWCFSGVSPRSGMRPYAGFLQWAAQHHMAGAYVEWSGGENWYLDGAKYWILLQLLSDPYSDIDTLWKRYCDDLYGPASETMFRFFRHFEDKYVYAPDRIELADLPRQEPALFTAEDLAYERGLLEQAIQQTHDDPRIQDRLATVMRYFIGHELFAKAVAVPHALDFHFPGEGINQAALAYYVNEAGNPLAAAIDYFQHQRTIAPDDNDLNTRLGDLPSYVNNYTRAKGKLLVALRREAMAGMDLRHVDAGTADRIVAASRRVLHAHLPARANPEKVRAFEEMLGKVIAVPTLPARPRLDGDLSDAVWERAARLEGFTERDTLTLSPHQTSGKVMRVGDQLIVGLTCRQVGPIWAETPSDVTLGTRIWRESGAEFHFGALQTADEEPALAQYVINALGAWRGFRQAADNRDGVEVAVKLDRAQNLYTIEAAFPLKAKGYDFTREKLLSFNVMRIVYSHNSFIADTMIGWHPVFLTATAYHSRGVIVLE